MKKSDLKQLIKPVVKECIREVLLEEGLLSNVVSEVVRGLQGTTLTDSPKRAQRPTKSDAAIKSDMAAKSSTTRKKMQEHREKMMHAVGDNAYNGVNLFEGITPTPAEAQKTGHSDLGDPSDSGVDISSLMGDSSNLWQQIK